MESYVNREEFNGLGSRLNKLEVNQATSDVKITHNSEAIERMFTNFETKSKQFSDKADKLTYGVIVASIIMIIGLFVKEFIFRG